MLAAYRIDLHVLDLAKGNRPGMTSLKVTGHRTEDRVKALRRVAADALDPRE
jgi:hypothetical protein